MTIFYALDRSKDLSTIQININPLGIYELGGAEFKDAGL